MPEIDDAIVVGHDITDDQEVVLFVTTAAGVDLDDDLRGRIRSAIRSNTTPRHVPHHIFEVTAIPYTISGKKVEKAVCEVLAGRPVLNRDTLADPGVLDEYASFADRL